MGCGRSSKSLTASKCSSEVVTLHVRIQHHQMLRNKQTFFLQKVPEIFEEIFEKGEKRGIPE